MTEETRMPGPAGPTVAWRTIKLSGGMADETEDTVATEFPLTIRLDGEEFATLVCSPDDLDDLIVGFLASEGVVRTMADIRSWSLDEERGFAYVELTRPQSTAKELHSKRIIGSCCGKSRQFYFQNDARTARTISGGAAIPSERCFELMSRLQSNSDSFRLTGGVHNAALFDGAGSMIVRADIGRHNALDKLFGHCLRNRLTAHDRVLAFSGRLSSEVVLKAAKIGCPIVLSKSAPTDLALRLAEDLGLTCVGFIRSDSMNVYTHARRIQY
ncbi:formate dehydrogenase accessory sulfurtransferase FdhD [Cohnella hongkongensis]|uniref:Sulfur carrier protein FdhD n=1 Tax=Cohnella hongkongensis TaxID=178337 RepID=A0ABV9F5W3_9BACL